MFRPPVARGMRTLDRAFFQKTIALKAARVFDNKNISKIRSQLERSKDILRQERLASIYIDPDPEMAKMGRKCILLRPEVRTESAVANVGPQVTDLRVDWRVNDSTESTPPWPHSSVLTDLVNQKLIFIIPFSPSPGLQLLDLPRHYLLRPPCGRASRNPFWLLAGRARRTP